MNVVSHKGSCNTVEYIYNPVTRKVGSGKTNKTKFNTECIIYSPNI